MKKVAIVDIAHDSSFFLKRGAEGTSFFEIETASLGVFDSEETLEKRFQIVKTKLSVGVLDREKYKDAYSGKAPYIIFLPQETPFENTVEGNRLILGEGKEIEKLFSWEERHNFFNSIKDMSSLPSSEDEENPWKARWSLRKFWNA